MPSTRREVLGAAAAPFVLTRRRAVRRPNVVMFMTDDHGAWASSAYGCGEIHTPTMSALAQSGVRFQNAFACTPVCSPSRMTYMTGTLPSTHGIQDWILPEESTGPKSRRWLEGHTAYSEVLAKNGYTLGMCGKWHMGRDEAAQAGFTYWATVPGGGGTYRDPEFVANGERRKMRGFKTNLVGDFALEFLNQQKRGNPFYLLVPFYAPHTPYDYQPEEDRAHYLDSTFTCFPEGGTHPWQNRSLAQMHGKREPKHAYSALVSGADRNAGRIVKRLEELGLREDTLVIFTADQGWNAGHHGVWGKGNGTVPFNLYEESLRVAMIWNHPGRIRASAPTPLISSYDYFPTLLEYLNITVPKDPRRVGKSYAAFLRGQTPAWNDRLYFEYAYVRGIRTRNLKYIERISAYPSELFDLEADRGETTNVIDRPDYKTQREALHRELTGYFARNGAPPIEEWRKSTRQTMPN